MVPVLNLLIVDQRLIVLSADNVVSLPLASCGRHAACLDCMARLECAWDRGTASCVEHAGAGAGQLIHHQHQCPVVTTPPPTTPGRPHLHGDTGRPIYKGDQTCMGCLTMFGIEITILGYDMVLVLSHSIVWSITVDPLKEQ